MAEMTKGQKLKILDDLIRRIKTMGHSNSGGMQQCLNEAESFVRNVLGKNSMWVDKIDKLELYLIPPYLPTLWHEDPRKAFISILESIKNEVEMYPSSAINISSKRKQPNKNHAEGAPVKSNKVFIVHGHNEAMKLSVARMIEQLGLRSIILHEQTDGESDTIIAKFEQCSSDVGFAIVLVSADDEMADGKYRARQNAILELGYFRAKLGNKKVVLLYDKSDNKNPIDLPSDLDGVIYTPYKPDGSWKLEIIKKLRTAGYNVSADSLTPTE